MTRKRLGRLRPRYRFALNPFPEVRWSSCPRCRKLMHARKFPLLIHIGDAGLLVLGKTCRYCTPCEFIIAHQHELEEQLVYACEQREQHEAIGNPYLVLGTVDRKFWQKSLREASSYEELFQHTSDIKKHYTLLDPRPRLGLADSLDTSG